MPVFAALALLAAGALPTSVNLAPDPGFERPVTGWPLPPGFAIDAAIAHEVSRSLRRDVGPGSPYTLSFVDLPLRPGEAALVRVWVRSRGLVRVTDVPGWELGASWFAEFWDGPSYRGGQYPQGVLGDSEWTLLEDVLRVPAGLPPTTRVIFGLYTRQGLEGTAWFDDVEIFRSLVQPVGFEDGPAPFALNAEWLHDGTRGFRGTASLRVDRPDPGTACRWGEAHYFPIAVPLALEPGRAYRGIVHVETPGLAIGLPCQPWGPVGASLFFESNDADGVYLTGRYPAGAFDATSGWRRVEAEYVPPANAARSIVGLYMGMGQTGQAWFDELVVVPSPSSPLTLALKRPSYRNTLFPGGSIELAATLDAQGAWLDASGLELLAVLRRADGSIVASTSFPAPLPAALSWTFPASGLTPGEDLTAEARLRLVATGEVVQVERRGLHVASAAEAAAARIRPDERGFLTRDGRPLFPVGLYAGACDPAQLTGLVGSGADSVILYNFQDGQGTGDRLVRIRTCLDWLAANGLSTFAAVKNVTPYRDCATRTTIETCGPVPGCFWAAGTCRDACWNSNGPEACDATPGVDHLDVLRELAAEFAGHPALLGWYLNDEMGAPYLAEVEQKYQTLLAADPAHPVLMAHYDKDLIALFEGRGADLYGTDIYPIPGNVPAYGSTDPCIGPSPLRRAGELLAGAQSATLGRGVPFIISQLHGLWSYPDLLPCGWGGAPRDERRRAFPAPTREQATYLFFDGLARGARGALGYSLFDVADEDRLYEPDRLPWIRDLLGLVKRVGQAAADGFDLGSLAGADPVRSRSWQSGNDVYVVLVNDGPGALTKLFSLRRPPEGAVVDLSTGNVVPRIFGRILVQLGPERALVLHYRTTLVP
jgi:hypothetical protein